MSPTLRFVLGRAGTTLATVLGALLLLFTLGAAVPGNPADTLLGPQATPEYAARFIREMGLDRPVWERLPRFLGNVLRGDLGTDVVSGRSVAVLVGEALPPTLALTGTAIGLAVLLGVPLGCFAALRPGSKLDGGLAVLSVAFIALPSFVVAIGLLLVFSTWLDWLPVLGTGSGGAWDAAKRLVLPAVALALGWIGYVGRLTRTSMLEVMAEPYIRTALAYGLPRAMVVGKYALKNACIPTVAVLGVGVGRLLGGAVLVEIVFARPGLGRLVFDAISVRNFPVLQGAVLVVVLLFVAANLLADLSYAWLDPRIRRAR